MKNKDLHWAAANNKLALIVELIEEGADINSINSYGKTALHRAVSYGHRDVINLLLGREVRLEIRDNNNGDIIEVRNLRLEQEASRDIKDKYGNTPLHQAALSGIGELIPLLFSAENINQQNYKGNTPLHFAVENAAIVNFLLSQGANLDIRNVEGKTPIHLAVQCGNLQTINAICQNNPDNIKLLTADGNTVFHEAIIYQKYNRFCRICK